MSLGTRATLVGEPDRLRHDPLTLGLANRGLCRLDGEPLVWRHHEPGDVIALGAVEDHPVDLALPEGVGAKAFLHAHDLGGCHGPTSRYVRGRAAPRGRTQPRSGIGPDPRVAPCATTTPPPRRRAP